MAKTAKKPARKPPAKKPAPKPAAAAKEAPARALNGGESCFNADGSPVVAVWKAMCKIKDDSDSVVSKLENRTKDRGALEKELEDLDEGDDEYTDKVLELYKTTREIKRLREQRDQFISRYGKIIELTNANKFTPAMTPKEMYEVIDEEEAATAAAAEEAKVKQEEKDSGQLQIPRNAVVIGTGHARPSEEWKRQYNAAPEAFGGKAWGDVNAQVVGKLRSHVLPSGSTWPSSPLLLSAYIAGYFEAHTKTEDRKYCMPIAEGWFIDGLRDILARQVRGELIVKGVEEDELDVGRILINLQKAADTDVEAWLQVCGGRDSALNKAINDKPASKKPLALAGAAG